MNFSFVIKMIFVSFFVFILIYAINYSSSLQYMISSNNLGVKNTTKEALNLGDLRVYEQVTYNDNILLESTIKNYIKNNNIDVENVDFDIAVNDNIVTVRISTNNDMFAQTSFNTSIFSYKIERRE